MPKDTIKQFLEFQEKDLEIRREEIEQRKLETNYNFELSRQSIDAQERDRNEQRNYFKSIQSKRYFFIGIISISVLIILGIALWLGESELVMRIIEITALIIAGGLGGYAIGYNKGQRKSENEE